MVPTESATAAATLERILEVLQHTYKRAQSFEADIEGLEQRRRIWTNDRWRVGVFGVTSSGKSTLINALLNERLLPAKVRPSSNCLVVCSHGPTARAIVKFADGREQIVTQKLADHLSELADEENNADNHRCVAEIELESPGMRFGDQVTLVDSPGLNAWGCDGHERLTLQMLLPTVDLAIFVTTAKANADAKIAEYLGMLAKAGKPVVLVQNMIDTVEPKLGALGRVLKPAEEVAREHAVRLRRLVDHTAPAPELRALVQVSATRALNGEVERSGVSALVDGVNEQIALMAPELEQRRQTQLVNYCAQILDGLVVQGDARARRRKLEERTGALRKHESDLDNVRHRFDRAIQEVRQREAQAANSLVDRANALTRSSTGQAKEVAADINAWLEGLGEALEKLVTGQGKSLSAIAAGLDLSERDYVLGKPGRTGRPAAFAPAIDTVSYQETRNGPGPWNEVLRTLDVFDSGLGRETVTRHRSVLHVDSFRDNTRRVTDNGLRYVEAELTRVRADFERKREALAKEVDQQIRRIDAERRRELALEDQQVVHESLARVLKPLQANAPRERRGSGVHPVTTTHVAAYERVARRLTPAVRDLIEVAQHAATRRFIGARDGVLDRMPAGARRRILVWGWDATSLDAFLRRFFPEVVWEARAPGVWQGIAPPFTEVVAVDERAAAEADVRRHADWFVVSPAVGFVLVDIDQPGAAGELLPGSLYVARYATKNTHCVVVAQSALGTLPVRDRASRPDAAAFVDALRALRELTQALNLSAEALLVNDEDVHLSLLADWLHRDGAALTTQRAETEWIECLRPLGPRPYVPEILRAWRAGMRGEREANPS